MTPHQRKLTTLINNFCPFIGMRTIKTGLAVMVVLYIAQTGIVSNAFYAAIGTVLAMQQTVKDSLSEGKSRLLGSLLGGFIGFIFASTFITTPPIIAISVIISILICNRLNLSSAISITLTVSLSILISLTDQSPLTYSFLRAWDTSIGIIIGVLINILISRPNKTNPISEQVKHIRKLTKKFIKEPQSKRSLSLIATIKDTKLQLDTLYQDYKKDLLFEKNKIQAKEIKKQVQTCHEIYFHLKSIKHLSSMETHEITDKMKDYHLHQTILLIEQLN